MTATSTSSPWRIGIIGGGPRAFFLLDSLLYELSKVRSSHAVEVMVFEPAEFIGAGLVYDPGQPDCLLMNFAAGHIDAYAPDTTAEKPSSLNFRQWAKLEGVGDYSEGTFVPRAVVGRYLHSCYQQLITTLNAHVKISHHRESVREINRAGKHWSVATPIATVELDEVLIATGHQHWQTNAVSRNKAGDKHIPVVSAYPALDNLTAGKCPPGTAVAVRGITLSFIDTVMALTVARGGRFVDTASGYEYRPSGNEPSVIYPCSRSGRPALPKPAAFLAADVDQDSLWYDARQKIFDLCGSEQPVDFSRQVSPILFEAADRAVNATAGQAEEWFKHWQTATWKPQSIKSILQRSLNVATGRSPRDSCWALGEMWRQVYPALVELVSYSTAASFERQNFDVFASHMEPLAFGPPIDSVSRVLALVEKGNINFDYARWFSRHPADEWPEVAEFAVIATIPAPAEFDPAGPIAHLLKAGLLQQSTNGGIKTNKLGAAVTNGSEVSNLFVFGRATEGPVLGSDTLNRLLQPQPQRWAAHRVSQLERC